MVQFPIKFTQFNTNADNIYDIIKGESKKWYILEIIMNIGFNLPALQFSDLPWELDFLECQVLVVLNYYIYYVYTVIKTWKK